MFGIHAMKILLLAIFFVCSLTNGIYTLPAPKHLLNRVKNSLVSMKRLIEQCERHHCNKHALYLSVREVDNALNDVEDYLQKNGWNNVVVGNNNRVVGTENIVIGHRNTLVGDDNWIIESKGYSGSRENFLIYNRWAIDMSKKKSIKHNPWQAIKRF